MTTPACTFCELLDDRGSADWIERGPMASAFLPPRSGWLAPGHTLVIPNEHAPGVQDASPDGIQAATLLVQRVAKCMADAIDASGVNVLNASGPFSGQSIPHLHFHVVPWWTDDGLETWPRHLSRHTLENGWADELRSALRG